MIRGLRKYGLALLLCLGISNLYALSSYAAEYVLDSGAFESDYHVSAWSKATDSDALIMPLSSYTDVYDGSISTTITTYMRGIVARFSPSVHYVLFRESQYIYRLVYGDNLSVNGSTFTGSDLQYIRYDSRYYTVTQGDEGNFSLKVNSYTVYTDLDSMYPVLNEGVTYREGRALLFCLAVMLVFNLVKAFFSSGRTVI